MDQTNLQQKVEVPGFKQNKKINKIVLFLSVFLIFDALLIIVYLYLTGGINIGTSLNLGKENVSNTQNTKINDGKTVNILSLAYIPLNGDNLDLSVIDNSTGSYDHLNPTDIKNNINKLNDELATDLEDGSKYHYYKNTLSKPAISYSFYNKIVKFETIPFTDGYYRNDPKIRILNYNAILNSVNICKLVDEKGVNEVWIWTYTSNNVKGWASNMAGPYGDISNSNMDEGDMPICSNTYTVYLYDYSLGIEDAFSKHVRQFETLFSRLNLDLFWYKFVGYFSNSKWEGNWGKPQILDQKRRCGSDFFPPNATDFNQWDNTDDLQSDCTDWDPNGKSEWKNINCTVWNCTETGFYIFWMQNIPGPDNNLTYNGTKLRNWWDFISNFDEAMKLKQDLVY